MFAIWKPVSCLRWRAARRHIKGLNWTEKGDALAVLRGVEDKPLEDKPYSLVAFRNFSKDRAPEKISFDPAKDSSFPKGMSISPNRNPVWMADLTRCQLRHS